MAAVRSCSEPRTPCLILALSALVAGGCGGAAKDFATRSDSSGVAVVTSHAPKWGETARWIVDAEPILRLGVANGDAPREFSRIRGVGRLANGTIVVGDGASQEIRYFDSKGTPVLSVGGAGNGPGKFGLLWKVQTQGDSVVAWDGRNRRVTVFDSWGLVLHESHIELPFMGGLEWIGVFPDGNFLLTQSASLNAEEPEGLHRRSQPVMLLAPGSSTLDTVTTLPSIEFDVVWSTANEARSAFEVPFARTSTAAVGIKFFYAASNDRFEIRKYDRNGQLSGVIRYPGAERAIDSREVSELEAAVLRDIDPSPSRRLGIERLFREVPRPSARPAFGDLLVDNEGYLWVAEWQSGFTPAYRAPASWWVFDLDGNLLGAVDMPTGFRPKQIGAGFVLGVAQDELGVERVEMYGLHR